MKISTKIFIAFGIILLFFSITTLNIFQQAHEVRENTRWVSNSQLVIRLTARLQRNMVDMESDLRGFLLMKDPYFIKSFDSLSNDNQKISKQLKILIKNEKFQEAKLDTIMKLHNKWSKEIAQPIIKREKHSQEIGTLGISQLERNREEKVIRRRIIEEFKEFNNYEYQLRDIRRSMLNKSVASTREISIALTVISMVIGLAVAFYVARVITKRIYKMVNLADSIAKGDFNIEIRDKSKDELTNLSNSLNQMARTLKENFTELESKNRELDQFAYIVSHDLKAPLRGIENVTMWIQEDLGGELSPKMKEYLGLLVGRTKRMENLIQGILDLSKVGRTKQIIEKVDVKELIFEIIEMQAPSPNFKFIIPEKMPVFFTEKILLQQVFANLLSNSVKYHHREKGTIEVGWYEEEDCYKFFVKDDGPGISPKYHEKIFIVFQTLKERDAFESTGVGLSIVKKILLDKKCSIQIFSEEGKGATFEFSWIKHFE